MGRSSRTRSIYIHAPETFQTFQWGHFNFQAHKGGERQPSFVITIRGSASLVMTRSTHIQIRLSEEEKTRLRGLAESAGLPISAYVRDRLLMATVLDPALNRRIKQLHAQGHTTPVATQMALAERT